MGDGLFPDNKKQPLLPGNSKQGLFKPPKKGPVNLFSPDVLERLEKERDEAETKAKAQEAIIASMPKYPVYRMYDGDNNLLFVTTSPQHQVFLRNRDWYLQVAFIKVSWHKTKLDQESAKLVAIKEESPKHNNHYAENS